ncbi:intradiol ring-cleavage dioxygenase [Trinickia symbiotica]|uniref:intradiol ring-cleavage dioxygenase n=1 Tax=Trinickia symbiotica TaxID=863227 RepID=UPI0015E77D3C|nr:intradiol ring-cleavage dioxygenase [Trinickia symbiotica]
MCKLTPEQEVGPYYLDDNLVRSDVTEGKPGVPLTLDITVMDVRRCAPLVGAIVDIWHCDALGIYSGFTQMGGPPGPPPDGDHLPHEGYAHDRHPPTMPPGPPPTMTGADASDVLRGRPAGPPPNSTPSDHLTFLRGIQRTDGQGIATFHTIVPGNYMGRTNHIHFKVRGTGATHADSHVSHVGQVFFPEALMVQLMNLSPYRNHRIHRTTLDEDSVFTQEGGSTMSARVSALHGSDYAKGLVAQVVAVVDPEANPRGVSALGTSR